MIMALRGMVVAASLLILALLIGIGWPDSPEVFFDRTNAGGGKLIATTAATAALSLVLISRRSLICIVLSGIVFVLGMLPCVGMIVEQSNL
jgi:hypothetical protein